ncbi:MAG: T9SS type A sorting domain-containing protein, partial [Bacteroidota bacterium]
IHQLFVDNGVNIFFQGHDHVFAHEVMDGITYQALPMPCDSTYEIGMLANADAYVSDTLDGSGHIKVTVSTDCVKVDYVRAYLPADTLLGVHRNREVAFSYSVGNCQSSGINENLTGKPVNIYPNPAKDILTIQMPETAVDFKVRLLNLIGQTLLESQSNTLNVSNIKNGIYLLNIKTADFELNKKVIISK